jgi:spore coat polysaccharide biosynthesis protein SpsF (cytidylyltransferase family)
LAIRGLHPDTDICDVKAESSETGRTDYSLWKTTRHMKRLHVQISSIHKEDGTWARSEQEKFDLHAQHFERVFLPNAVHSELDNVLDQYNNNSSMKHLKKLNVRQKSPKK